jgi:DNA-binding NarL/FixJ family response regulator
MPEDLGSFNNHLPKREKEFCSYLIQGYKIYEIGFLMDITEETAKTMSKNIHLRLGIKGHSKLIVYLLSHKNLFE